MTCCRWLALRIPSPADAAPDLTWVSIAAAIDATLSSILMSQFIKGIRRDGFAQTNSMLTSLARATLEWASLPPRTPHML